MPKATTQPQGGITFFDTLKAALEQYTQPEQLGEQSPLAAPYFLGAAITPTEAATPLGRGQALCRVLEQALTTLWGDVLPTQRTAMLQVLGEVDSQGNRTTRYDVLVLELNYFQRCFTNPAPRNQAEIYDDILHISRPTHDRHLRNAISRLGETLLAQVRPTFHLENPLPPATLIGRTELKNQVLALLQSGQSVALVGPGGIGKTALGAAIYQHWSTPARFWFTIRPTVNDQLRSLLFALGHFFHQHGSSSLWSQLIANGGKLEDANLALGLAKADLAQLDHLPLLCLDEIDLLQPPDAEKNTVQHTQLYEFIHSLLGCAPMLIIGQRARFTTTMTYPVPHLLTPAIVIWLQQQAIPATHQEIAALATYTGGNMRLLELCAALYQMAQAAATTAIPPSWPAILAELPQTPALAPIWQRLEQRLSKAERQLLQALAVFRTPAPQDAWTMVADSVAPLHHLLDLHLVQANGQGGIFLLPALRELIYSESPIEWREQAHCYAAQVRLARGEYTAAAYHYVQSGAPELAMESWYPQREQEINRGQADAALLIFQQVSLQRLPAKAREQLALLRSELYAFTGQPEKAQADLASVQWAPDQERSIDAALLWGNLLNTQGDAPNALAKYDEGLDLTTRLLNKNVLLHVRKSNVHLLQRTMTQAWREANLARYTTENLFGTIQDMSGNPIAARSHYRIALALAEDLNFVPGIARSHYNLAILAMRQQELQTALAHHTQALHYYQQAGDRIHVEKSFSLLATIQMQAGDYQAALASSQRALRFFQTLQDPQEIALNANNLAESYLELGDLAQAQHYAELVIAQEEPDHHGNALFTLGRLHQAMAHFTTAEAYLQQAQTLCRQHEDRYLLAYTLRELGLVYRAQQKMVESQLALQEAHHLFVQQGIPNEATQTERLLLHT